MLQSFSVRDFCPGVDFDINIRLQKTLFSACISNAGTFYSGPTNLSPVIRAFGCAMEAHGGVFLPFKLPSQHMWDASLTIEYVFFKAFPQS